MSHGMSELITYRGYYPRHSAEGQAPPYYGVAAPPTTWASSIPQTYTDDTNSGVGVEYPTLSASPYNNMMPMYSNGSSTRWSASKPATAAVYVSEASYSPVYSPATTVAGTAEPTISPLTSRSDSYSAMGAFPGMGRMAASLPTPPALADGSKRGILPAPGQGLAGRTPLPSSPGNYRIPPSVQTADGLPPNSSPIDTGAEYYSYPPQPPTLASAETPLSATRSTLPGNGSTVSLPSTSTGETDPGLYAAPAPPARADDFRGQLFPDHQHLKTQESNESLNGSGYRYDANENTAYPEYIPAGMEIPCAPPQENRTSSRVGLRA